MKRLSFLVAAVSFCLFSSMVHADSAAIKARMKARIAKLVPLKKAQTIGENNKGFLQVTLGKSLSGDDKKLVDGENADRAAVYAAIAKKVGASAEQVGQRRALELAKTSPPGTRVQAPDGTWKTR